MPDEAGRLQIFKIHTKKMKENKKLADDMDLAELARRAQNFSGAGSLQTSVLYRYVVWCVVCITRLATRKPYRPCVTRMCVCMCVCHNARAAEIAGLIRSAVSFASERCIKHADSVQVDQAAVLNLKVRAHPP